MLSFYLLLSLSYFTLLWWMSRFWTEKKHVASNQVVAPSVTLLVPFRNEVENVRSLSSNLKKLSYPNLEILLIDDHSEDNSLQLMEACFEDTSTIHVLQSPSKGKKAALEYGVTRATGDLILTTDADCCFPEHWVHTMVVPFQNPNIHLVAGAVLVEKNSSFVAVFQVVDWASILLMTNFSFLKQNALMCSGANLAYRKVVFEKVNGYEGNREFASGDDEFLLKKIHKRYGATACCYLTSEEILVRTKPEPNWQGLLSQRIRWASKWKAHFSLSHALPAAGAFTVQVIWIGSFYLLFLGAKGIVAFVVIWLVKIAAEKLSLGKVLKSFSYELSDFAFIRTSVTHPFYVLTVGLGALVGKFTWKGRSN